MKETVKRLLDRLPFGANLKSWPRRWRQSRELAAWERRGRPSPPPHGIKQRVLRELARERGMRIFVETGTHYGDMVAAMRPHFARIYSIELSAALYEECARRFRRCSDVELIQGDSGVELGKLVPRLDGPALFWLDGHYSAGPTAKGFSDTPILNELRHILEAKERRHVIVIDDARVFGTDSAYPTVAKLESFVRSLRPEMTIDVDRDTIRVVPS